MTGAVRARRLHPRVALAHLGERVAERAGGVEEVAVVLHAAERLVLVLPVGPDEMRRQLAPLPRCCCGWSA